ncbi:cysteine hydrolase family protein [Mucilaginibacter sp. KACC 22773]|uniref:cysteine hydrolase family protein n=1 Tax=Mucilaginibacter sp. KACC 22773 TaxID=3025671 RepID=UPI0023652F84|nr:cysteine hydrolase family protein [Mucilaginibacter sp. KACC 22773]WDF79761.1 cysteine hydrolase family protein [Mucilaginibacter sp. KACC 22773]
MKTLQNTNPALILVDIQQGFDNIPYWGGQRNNPDAEVNARKLLDYWRANNLPLFHIQRCSANPNSLLAEGNPGNAHKEIVKPLPGETVIKKSVNSSFIGTNLQQQLDAAGIDTMVIVGLTTEHCVSTTARMAGNFGYHTFVVADATAAFAKTGIKGEHYDAETIHLTALAQINNEFATVLNTDEVLQAFKKNDDFL